MTIANDHLKNVFQEVSDYFANIQDITVRPGEGSPPDYYTVTYNVAGVCKKNNGEVYSCDTHVISISLPFGFPHFPPNCLPESPTFHPDFDSSAICINDVWDTDKSIVHLIQHMGKMIGGEFFSKSNAFNEEAAKWYQANSDLLPFDSSSFDRRSETPDTDKSIDTQEGELFVKSIPLESDDPPENEVDVNQLELLASQKRFHSLARELQNTKQPFNGRNELQSQTEEAIATARNSFKNAEKLEHKGQQQKALNLYLEVEEKVADYPLIQESKERVQQAFDLLGDWVNGNNQEDDLDDWDSGDTLETDFTDKAFTPPPATRSGGKKKRGNKRASTTLSKRSFFEKTKDASKKWLLFTLIGGVVILAGMLVFSYFSLGENLKQADIAYTTCKNLLNKNDFKNALNKCTEARTLLSEMKYVRRSKKGELNKKIGALLSSTKLRQGLAGNILYEGNYVSIATKNLLVAFKEAGRNGNTFFQEERWHEATQSYTKALNIAAQTPEIKNIDLAEIRKLLPRALFNSLMLAGEKAMAISDWNGTTKYFSKALTLAKENSSMMLPEDISQLELLSIQAEFNALRERAHVLFEEKKWAEALTNYEKTLSLVKELELTAPEIISDLQENIVRTKIYMAIEKGQKAFAESKWDKVTHQYKKAITLLERNSALLRTINTEEIGKKLSRIMLHATIVQDKQDLARCLEAEEYESAIEKLEEITTTINSSKFAALPEFKAILDQVANQISESTEEMQIREQSTYLTDNFKKLFLKHYPAATNSILSSPKVEFLKNIENKLLFRMQCTEKAGGGRRPLRLQMDYLYTPSNASWNFYSDK